MSQKPHFLSTPTIVTARTFCASGDTRVSYGKCPLVKEYFCVVQTYTEKVELSKCSWYQKKIGGNHAFIGDN